MASQTGNSCNSVGNTIPHGFRPFVRKVHLYRFQRNKNLPDRVTFFRNMAARLWRRVALRQMRVGGCLSYRIKAEIERILTHIRTLKTDHFPLRENGFSPLIVFMRSSCPQLREIFYKTLGISSFMQDIQFPSFSEFSRKTLSCIIFGGKTLNACSSVGRLGSHGLRPFVG